MNGKRETWVHFVVLLSLLLIPFGDALAQEDPFQIFFTPDPAYIYTNVGTSIVVKVDLANAVNIWSFDIMIEYDESVAILTSYEYIDLFGGIVCPYQVNNPGYFVLSCGGWGGLPFSGDGTLIELTFERVAIGTTPLTFTMTSFGNKNNQPVPVVADNGVLNVVDPTSILYLPLIANTMEG